MTGRFRSACAGLVTAALVLPAAPAIAETSTSAAAAQVAALVTELEDAAPIEVPGEAGDPIAGRLLVTFRDGVASADAQALLDAAGTDSEVVPGFHVQVAHVAPERAAGAIAHLSGAPTVASVGLDRWLDIHTATADPRRMDQWWWRNDGQEVHSASGTGQRGHADIDIGAASAWRASRGDDDVVVAVIDTGLDTGHPDLRPNLWINPRPDSFPGCSSDTHGCNFTDSGGPGDVYDSPAEDEHGTHIAGVIAAAENEVGTVGIAPRVRLMSVKFLKGTTGSVADGIRAVQYAVHSGADVINASWGVPGTARDHRELEATIEDAGIPVVAAAGNTGADLASLPEYPASSRLGNVITVTAIDNVGHLPPFASWSRSLVDVAAPGVGVLSTFPGGRYGQLDGSSQAAPMVTGLVALAISATGVTDGTQLAEAVRRGARPFGPLKDATRPSGATRAGLASAPGTLHALGADLGACRGGAPQAPFRDLARGNVHTSSIDCIVHHGLASGFADRTFGPNGAVNRGQVASFLAGLLRTARDLPTTEPDRFRDVAGNVHRDNIEALAAGGIIDGYADDTYRPNDPVTREQFASLLVRTYEGLVGGRVRVEGHRFPDVGPVHERAVRVGSQLGFIQGRADGHFGPSDGLTRGQLASLLRRALDKLVNDRVSRVG